MGLISDGTTMFDAGAMASGFGGSMTFIKKLTASGSGTLSFVDGASSVVLDNTYKEYLFTFKDIHPATDSVEFQFQVNAVGGSGYNETITSTAFDAFHKEDNAYAGIEYDTTRDKAQGTSFQAVNAGLGNGSDESVSGTLRLFNPSSTTFVKHFMSNTNTYYTTGWSLNWRIGGYINTTSAIDEIQFKMSSGNIDAGDICLYGIA